MKKTITIWVMLLLLFSFTVIIERSEAETYNFQLRIYNGWNLITIAVETDMMASNLKENISGCQFISKFDSVAQSMWTYTGNPASDFTILDGYGYLLYTSMDSNLSIVGETITSVDVDINTGLNLLGWYESDSTTASDVMSITAGCTQVKGFDPLTQKEVFYNSSSDPDFTINQGDGYWINYQVPKPLTIYAPSFINEGESFQVTVTSEGTPIESVKVTFKGNTYYTNITGKVDLSAPSVTSDTVYTITASKTGYNSDDFQITINAENIELPELAITSYSTVEAGNIFLVNVKSNGTNIEGALVTFLGYQYYTNADGAVSLVAPSVFEDAIYTITASKIGYLSDTLKITIQNKEITYGELVISVPSTINEKDSFLVEITYNDSAVEDASVYFLDNVYTTDSNGKVTLFTPTVTKDTTYSIIAQKTGYQSGETSILVKNTIISDGIIYGTVLPQAKICVYYSESGITKNKCTYSYENGYYSISIPPGTYALKASKNGYLTSTIENVQVLENEEVNIDITLEEGMEENLESFADYTIEEEVKKGNIFGKVDSQNNIVTMYGDVNIELVSNNLSGEGIQITVSGNGTPRTKIVVYLGQLQDPSDLVVKYDGIEIQRTRNIASFFNDTNNRSEWILTLLEEEGITEYILIINIPSFSEHTILMYTKAIQKISQEIMKYKEIVISAALIAIILAAIFMHKKSKEN